MTTEIDLLSPVDRLWLVPAWMTKQEAGLPQEARRVPYAGSELEAAGVALYVRFEEVDDVRLQDQEPTITIIGPTLSLWGN